MDDSRKLALEMAMQFHSRKSFGMPGELVILETAKQFWDFLTGKSVSQSQCAKGHGKGEVFETSGDAVHVNQPALVFVNVCDNKK